MTFNRPLILVTLAWLAAAMGSLWAEDWKTTDGQVYQDVKVIHAQPDAVTILHKNGGALVPLAKLPPELQQRFHYDPVKAKAAADSRAKDDAENAKALQAEMDQASQMRQPGYGLQDSNASGTSSSPVINAGIPSATTTSGDASHHSVNELATSAHALKYDLGDASHHSIDELTASSNSLGWDLYNPNYHTMAHLAYSIHSLGPDPSDPNHHSISEITASGL